MSDNLQDLINKARERTASMVKPNLVDRLADALEVQRDELERLNRRLYPGQGDNFANEVERQRYVIEELQLMLTAATTERDAARAVIAEALAVGSVDVSTDGFVAARDRVVRMRALLSGSSQGDTEPSEPWTDPFPWVCIDGNHRYSAAISSRDAKSGGLLYDPRSRAQWEAEEAQK